MWNTFWIPPQPGSEVSTYLHMYVEGTPTGQIIPVYYTKPQPLARFVGICTRNNLNCPFVFYPQRQQYGKSIYFYYNKVGYDFVSYCLLIESSFIIQTDFSESNY